MEKNRPVLKPKHSQKRGPVNPPTKGTGVNSEKLKELLSDGNVERVYWWQTVCERYGLIDHTNMEKYPAFNAYKKLVSLLSGSEVLSIKVENDGTQFSYKFKKNSAEFSIIWNRDGVESEPPRLNLKNGVLLLE